MGRINRLRKILLPIGLDVKAISERGYQLVPKVVRPTYATIAMEHRDIENRFKFNITIPQEGPNAQPLQIGYIFCKYKDGYSTIIDSRDNWIRLMPRQTSWFAELLNAQEPISIETFLNGTDYEGQSIIGRCPTFFHASAGISRLRKKLLPLGLNIEAVSREEGHKKYQLIGFYTTYIIRPDIKMT